MQMSVFSLCLHRAFALCLYPWYLSLPTEVLLTPPTPLPPPTPPPASADRGLPTPAPSPCPVPRPLAPLKPVRLHSFQEHVFKRASPCELCHQLIVGRWQALEELEKLGNFLTKGLGGHLEVPEQPCSLWVVGTNWLI